MGYICTRCGGTNVSCEAIVNPNTGKIIDYGDYIQFCIKDEKQYTFVRSIILGITNTLYRLLKSEIAGFFYLTKRF